MLVAILNTPVIPGVSHRLTEPSAWPILVNPQSGWICIGDPEVSEPFESVEFASDTIAVLKDGALRDPWFAHFYTGFQHLPPYLGGYRPQKLILGQQDIRQSSCDPKGIDPSLR